MDNEETMVEMNDDFEAADTPEGEVIEETDESEQSLDSLTGDGDESNAEPEQSQGTSEPGWFKSRWNKEVGKLSEQIRSEVRAEYDQKMAPLMERLIEMDAKDLVASGKVKDLETARELVRYRQGQPKAEPQTAEQPRNSNGQYAPKEDPVQQAQINLLVNQAEKIKARTGVDVIAIMDSDPEIKSKIVSGEMDFYDVLEEQKSKPATRKKAPAPMRSPNGAAAHSPNAIENMTDEQFRRMEDKISKGARYSLK